MAIAYFSIAFILSFFLTIPTISIAKKFHLVTDKKKRFHPAHTHEGLVPRGGGIPLYVAIALTTIIMLPINKIMFGILFSSLLLMIVGIIDDFSDTSPYVRFIANLIISSIAILFGLGIPFISNPFGGVIHLDTWKIAIDFLGKHSILVFADILAVIWLTWTTNIINWSKGVDGQLPGFVGITAIFLGIVAQRFTAHDISAQVVSGFSFIIAGAYLGFLPFNFYPQKIMPGYGGGGLAGFLLGIISILSFGKFGTAFLVLSVPIIDSVYTITRRIYEKKSPFKADWGHFHHKLLDIGWGKRRVAVFYWIVTFIFGVSSLFLEGVEKVIGFLMVGVSLVAFIIIIERVKKSHPQHVHEVLH